MCKVFLLCSAPCAKCSYYVVLHIICKVGGHGMQGAPRARDQAPVLAGHKGHELIGGDLARAVRIHRVEHLTCPTPDQAKDPRILNLGEKHITTLRMQLQPVFHCSSHNTLNPGSGRKIPAICHSTGVWYGHFNPES